MTLQSSVWFLWIAHIHRSSRGTYGAPRIHAELHEDGARVVKKRVARLMRELGLEGAHRTTTPLPVQNAGG